MERIAKMVSFNTKSENNKMAVIKDNIGFSTMSEITNLSNYINSTDDLKIIKYNDIKTRVVHDTLLITYFQNLPVDNIDNVF